MSVRFVFGSSIVYLAVVLAERIGGLLLVPLMTRLLTPADYGAMLLIANGSALINLLFGYSFSQALPALFANARSEAERRAVCTTVLLSIGVLLALIHAAAAVFSRSISLYFMHTPEYAAAIALGALASFLGACAICLVGIVRITERHVLYLFVQLPALVVQIVLIISLLVIAKLGIHSQYIAMSIASAVATMSYVLILRHWLMGEIRSDIFGKAARIGAQVVPWQLAIVLTTNSAAFFLTRAGHVDEAGLFTVAAGAAGLLIVASGSFDSVWTSFVLLRKDSPELPAVQLRVFSLYSSGLLVSASALCLFAHELFAILVGPAFREGYRLVPPLVIAYCVFGFATAFSQGMLARQGTVHYVWIGFVTSAIFLSACLLLVGALGALGVIIAMGVGFLSMLVLLQRTSRRLLPVMYPWPRHMLMWILAGGLVALVHPLGLGWETMGLKVGALIVVSALPFLFAIVRTSDLYLAKALIVASTR